LIESALPSDPGKSRASERTASGAVRLSVSGACTRFGRLEVLSDVSLTVGSHEIVSVVGPSGCGKTTLLRSIAGLTRLTSGVLQLEGQPVDGPLPGVAMVFQHFALFPWKSLWGNIAYGLKIRHYPRAEIERRVSEAIELVGLTGFEKSYPYQLSGGMQQRAGLARALVVEPRLLLMDEPFSAVDAQTRELLQFELLRIWDARPTAMLFVTHSIEEAVLMGDRVIVLAGRPSHVRDVFDIDLPRPRDRTIAGSDHFVRLRNRVWASLFGSQEGGKR